jgi:hypothetical protein
MSDTRPFDAAIFTLQQKLQSWIDALEDCERIQRYTGAEDGDIIKIKAKTNDIRAAIRVLEAAGKVDKENALWNIDEAFSQGRDHVEMMAPYKEDHNLENYNRADKEITTLLEALPGPEPEKEKK